MSRVGLGCMRIESGEVIAAALDAGITLFDTARSYGLGESSEGAGENERVVARAIDAHGARARVRIVTKCGMSREGRGWMADGRAGRIAEEASASFDALGGPPDVLLLHAPDHRVALATSVRALARAKEKGLAKAIGVSNVARKELEEAIAVAPQAAVEVALGAYDDLPIRGGVLALCAERSIELLAHAPLGGPKRVGRLGRDDVVAKIAARHSEVGAAGVFLAYLLACHPAIVPIVGARRPETIGKIVAASRLTLAEDELAVLDARFEVLGTLRAGPRSRAAGTREVALLMGIPGAGKSRAAEAFVARGYERLNRDTLGGTLRGIAKRLDERLEAGAANVVLDNTYVTRAVRNDVVRVAQRHGALVRCTYFATSAADAQINVVLRMIARFGHVLGPEEIKRRAKEDAAAIAPNAVLRMTRELEPPVEDEGFASVETLAFVREPAPLATRPSLAINADVVADPARREALVRSAPGDAAVLLFAWKPDADEAALALAAEQAHALAFATRRIVESAICAHPAGPPICWCRPPLAGMWLAFAHRHAVDARKSRMVGASSADRAMARALGVAFEEPVIAQGGGSLREAGGASPES